MKELTIECADIYFVHDDKFVEMYHNPDADAGGQIVCNEIPMELIQRASCVANNENEFFSILDSECTQYLFDKGTAEYDNLLNELAERANKIQNCVQDAEVGLNGRWSGTVEKLKEYAMSQLLAEDLEI